MSDDVHIEPLTQDLADRLCDELLAMTADSTWDDWQREHLLSDRPEKWQRSLVATRGDSPVGWAVVSRTGAGVHVHHIVVAAGERSAGLGAQLMGEVIRGAPTGVVTLKVHPDNTAAARFYERLGFIEGELTSSGYRTFSRDSENQETFT